MKVEERFYIVKIRYIDNSEETWNVKSSFRPGEVESYFSESFPEKEEYLNLSFDDTKIFVKKSEIRSIRVKEQEGEW